MNEYNIDDEQPDHHWEAFKKLLYLVGGIILIGTLLLLKYC